MASVKLQARSGDASANGFVACDFRGDGMVHPPVDHHKTLFEKDPAPDELVQKGLEKGPLLNQLLDELCAELVPAEVFGLPVGELLTRVGAGDRLRIGVFDE